MVETLNLTTPEPIVKYFWLFSMGDRRRMATSFEERNRWVIKDWNFVRIITTK
jgi:hypothetical protein